MSTENHPVPKRANQATVDEWIGRIQTAMGEHRRGVFQIGDLLVLAEEQLSKSAFKKVVAGAGIKSESSTNNYRRVARNKYMRDPEVFKHLPTSVGALIVMASWKKEGMLMAIKEGVLTPEATRDELVNWRKSKERPQKPNEPWEEDGVILGHIIGHKRDARDTAANDALHEFMNAANALSENQRFVLLDADKSQSRPRKSYTVARCEEIEVQLEDRLRRDPDGYHSNGLVAIFGEFEELGPLPFYKDWLSKLADTEYAELRKHVPLTEDELQFLLDYRRLHEAAVEADKQAAAAKKEKAAACAREVRSLPAPASRSLSAYDVSGTDWPHADAAGFTTNPSPSSPSARYP